VADNSGMLKVGLFAGAAFLAYRQGWFSSILGTVSPTSTSGTGAQPVGTTGSTVSQQPPAQPAQAQHPAASSLDDLGAQVVAAAGGQSMGPDGFNALVTRILPSAGPLPDPNELFGPSGWARPASMSFATYWAITAPWLKANKGLSGIGPHGLGYLCVGVG
jgi:hypothetical protein